jgi:glyoxylase-like metal-dependent hydrolase (beta-lactamase superfamily II)
MFCGDTLHHPIQVLKPEWNSSYDSDPEEARRTRRAILQLAADRDALLLPAHFGMPNCGYVRHASSGFAFLPSEWSE